MLLKAEVVDVLGKVKVTLILRSSQNGYHWREVHFDIPIGECVDGLHEAKKQLGIICGKHGWRINFIITSSGKFQ